MTTKALRILLVEDNPADARLIREFLREAAADAFTIENANSLEDARQAASRNGWDVALLDLHLGDSEGLETLIRFCSFAPELPVVVLTGLDDEQSALTALQQGAQDYVTKNHLDGILLCRALKYAIERNRILREQQRLERELRQSLSEVKRLHGLLPICMYCKSVRNDREYWEAIDEYLGEHSEIQLSHGICPNCYKRIEASDLPEPPSHKG